MAQNEIALSVKVIGTEKSIANIKDLKEEIKKVTESLEESDIGSKAYKDLQQQAAQLTAELGKLEKETEQLQTTFKGAEGVKETLESINKVSEAFLGAAEKAAQFYGFVTGNTEQATKLQEELAAGIEFVKTVSALAGAAEEAQFLKNIALEKILILQKTLEGGVESKNIVIRYAAIAAQRILNAVVASNPFGLLALAIGAVVGALVAYNATQDETTKTQEKHNTELEANKAIQEKVADSIAAQIAALTRLRTVLTDATIPLQQRKKALEEYNRISDNTNKLTETDLKNTEKINTAIEAQTKLIEKRAYIKAAEELLTEKIKEEIKAQQELTQSQQNLTAARQKEQQNLTQLHDEGEASEAFRKQQVQMVEFAQTGSELRVANAHNEVEAIKKILANAISDNKDALYKDGESQKKLEKANLDARIEVNNKALQIIIGLQKQQIAQVLNDMQEGRAKEVAQEDQKYTDLKENLIKNLDEIDGLIDAGEQKRIEVTAKAATLRDEINKKEGVSQAEKNKAIADIDKQENDALKKINDNRAQLLQERNQAGILANQILVKAEEDKAAAINAINSRYDNEDLQKQITDLQSAVDAAVAIENSAYKTEQQNLKAHLDETGASKSEAATAELQAEQKHEDTIYNLQKEAYEKQLKLLADQLKLKKDALQQLNGDASGNLSVNADDSPEVKAKKEEAAAIQKQFEELARTLGNLEQEHTDKVQEESDKRKDILKDESDQRMEDAQKALSGVSEIFSNAESAISALGESVSAQYDQRIQESQDKISGLEEAVKNSNGRQKKALQAQLDAEKSALKQAEAEKDATRKKYAKAKKAIDIIQAEISGAKSALEAYQSLVGIPYVGPVLGAIAAAAAIAFAQVQVAAIANTPLAQGGNLGGGDISNISGGNIPAGAGVISGPRHTGGGVRFKYRGNWYEAEGGELKTNNGKERYIFTRGVADDPVLRNIALATHNHSGHPVAGLVGSLVNMYAGGRSFGYGIGGMLASGGNLDNVLGAQIQPPVVATNNTDPQLLKLLNDVNQNQNTLRQYVDATNRRIDELKIVVPVDQVTDVQGKAKEVRTAGLF